MSIRFSKAQINLKGGLMSVVSHDDLIGITKGHSYMALLLCWIFMNKQKLYKDASLAYSCTCSIF